MWKTVIFLILTLIVVPLAGFYFDGEALTELQENTLQKLAWIYVTAAALCFVISTLSKNYSQVDKLWSTIPILYAWVVCVDSDFDPRMILMAVLVTLWGIRLTYNFSRRGGYSWKFWEGEEDYRWAVLRAKPEFQSPILWGLFNLFFISFYQMGLILLFTLPMVRAMGGGPLGWVDGIFAALFIFLIYIETKADQQQWIFQNEKHRKINNNEPLDEKYKKGFLDSGLWGLMRHPNYAAEQSIWIAFYLIGAVASGHILNWSIIGCVLLLVLFKSSADFSEGISSNKYPDYKDYIKRVPRFVPFSKFNK